MAELTPQQKEIASVYNALMTQIVLRVDLIRSHLTRIQSNPNDLGNRERLESCFLHCRYVCELLALSILKAHDEYRVEADDGLEKKWNAGELVTRVSKINPFGFPVPVTTLMDHHGPGQHHVEPNNIVLEPKHLSKAYGLLGSELHIGTLKSLLEAKKSNDGGQLVVDLTRRIARTLNNHMIRLPHIGSILLVNLKDESDGQVHCAWGATGGGFTMDGTLFEVSEVL